MGKSVIRELLIEILRPRDPPLTPPKRGIIRISYLRNCSARFISPEATKKVFNRNKRLESRVTALSVPTLVGDIVTITK